MNPCLMDLPSCRKCSYMRAASLKRLPVNKHHCNPPWGRACLANNERTCGVLRDFMSVNISATHQTSQLLFTIFAPFKKKYVRKPHINDHAHQRWCSGFYINYKIKTCLHDNPQKTFYLSNFLMETPSCPVSVNRYWKSSEFTEVKMLSWQFNEEGRMGWTWEADDNTAMENKTISCCICLS